MRGTGPIGYPGGAEVVNMQPPAALIKRGILSLPCIGDGRQSGTSGSPSILNASPEAAADGGLAILKTGDRVRIDLNKGSANILISDEELKQRRAELKAKGGFPYPANQTPWQELYRSTVGQQATGACMEFATRYQRHRRQGRRGAGQSLDTVALRPSLRARAKQSRIMSRIWIAVVRFALPTMTKEYKERITCQTA